MALTFENALQADRGLDAAARGSVRTPSANDRPLHNAGVGAALSVNDDGEVIFSQMVPGMPAANSGAISIGDALVSPNSKP
jgi:C-terminal processing protease CtpA/Prc